MSNTKKFRISTLQSLVGSLSVVLLLASGFVANAATLNVEYLIVAGGGGGGGGFQSGNNGGERRRRRFLQDGATSFTATKCFPDHCTRWRIAGCLGGIASYRPPTASIPF